MSILNTISSPDKVKTLAAKDLILLSQELRAFITRTILDSGGHFSSNLGVIELTIALFYTIDFNHDAIVWDVGHQSYPHKVLTNRMSLLNTIRSLGGISGFPKREESIYDSFGTGHSSTAISAVMGMAAASKLHNHSKQPTFVAVVGDGALTAGLSYEALNNLFGSNFNVLIILNDNQMGIDPNTGALNNRLQTNQTAVKLWFEWFGLAYSGPIDGHDMPALIQALDETYAKQGPRLLHIKTTKGKGYPDAEKEQTKWHSANKFIKIENREIPALKWQDVFGDMLVKLAEIYPNLMGITPAMPSSCGMIKAMKAYPDRFFDVGIAEQHALTFAAGMATQNGIPIVNIYSSFLQRGYDQLIHDIVLQKLPVILCIDRAGLVGEDGPTHHGAFDIAFLRCIPQLLIGAPRNTTELYQMILFGIEKKQPIAIRYPKGNVLEEPWLQNTNPSILEDQMLKSGGSVLVISTGKASNLVMEAYPLINNDFTHIHMPFIHANASKKLSSLVDGYHAIITVEDGCIVGGWGQGIAHELRNNKQKSLFFHLGIPHAFIEHGSNEELYALCGYSPGQIADTILKADTKT